MNLQRNHHMENTAEEHVGSITESEDSVEEIAPGDGERGEHGPSLYSPEVVAGIKERVRNAWELRKELHGATQGDLAEILGISQGAVSKLLNLSNSHPWTPDKIEKFAEFCDRPIEELVAEPHLFGHFNGWKGDGIPPDRRRIDEARAALQKFVDNTGSEIDEVKLHRLAGKLAVRVDGTDRTTSVYNQEIMKLLIAEA
jgi:transcriptional regulator with XRE-family HTH domain